MLKSQVALDRMTTYLFAIVITALIISTLYSTGFFSPQKPEVATGFLETPVTDFSLSVPTTENMQEFVIYIGNSVKTGITIDRIKLSKNGNEFNQNLSMPVPPGENKKIEFAISPKIVDGEISNEYDVEIEITYTNLDTGISHTDSGYLNGKLIDPGLIVSYGSEVGGSDRPPGEEDEEVENHTYSGGGVDFYFADVVSECRPYHCNGPELVMENERIIVVLSDFQAPTPRLDYLDYPIWIFSKETGQKYGTVGVLDDNGEAFSGTWIDSIEHPASGNYPSVSVIYHTHGSGCGGCTPNLNRRDIIFTLTPHADYLSWTMDNLPGEACHCGGAFIYDYPEVGQVWVSYSPPTSAACSNTTLYPNNIVEDNQMIKLSSDLCTWYSPAQTVPVTYPAGFSISADDKGIFGFIMELHNLGSYGLQASSGTNNLITQYVTETDGGDSPVSHHAILATRGSWQDILDNQPGMDLRSGTLPAYFKTPLIRINGTVQTLGGGVDGSVTGAIGQCTGGGNVIDGEYDFTIDCDLDPGTYLVGITVVSGGETEKTQIAVEIP